MPRRPPLRNDRGALPRGRAISKCACANKEISARNAFERKKYAAPEERRHHGDPLSRSCNPIKEEAATPCGPIGHPDYTTSCTVEKGKLDQCRTVAVVVILEMVIFDKVSLVGFFIITIRQLDSDSVRMIYVPRNPLKHLKHP